MRKTGTLWEYWDTTRHWRSDDTQKWQNEVYTIATEVGQGVGVQQNLRKPVQVLNRSTPWSFLLGCLEEEIEIIWAAVNQRRNVQRFSAVRAMRIKEATLGKGQNWRRNKVEVWARRMGNRQRLAFEN